MAQITTGLTNGGQTTHYSFTYEDTLQKTAANPSGPEPARTNAVIAAAEADFTQMTGWFGGTTLDVSLPAPVNVMNAGGGAGWATSGGSLTVTIKPGVRRHGDRHPLPARRRDDRAVHARPGPRLVRRPHRGQRGRGPLPVPGSPAPRHQRPRGPAVRLRQLQRVALQQPGRLGQQRQGQGRRPRRGHRLHPALHLVPVQPARLHHRGDRRRRARTTSGRSTATSPATPGTRSRSSSRLMDTAFPGTSTIPSGSSNIDNPFPLGLLSFWVDKSTYGRDEVSDVIASGAHGTFADAFWLVLEGFNIQSFLDNGISAAGAVRVVQGPHRPADHDRPVRDQVRGHEQRPDPPADPLPVRRDLRDVHAGRLPRQEGGAEVQDPAGPGQGGDGRPARRLGPDRVRARRRCRPVLHRRRPGQGQRLLAEPRPAGLHRRPRRSTTTRSPGARRSRPTPSPAGTPTSRACSPGSTTRRTASRPGRGTPSPTARSRSRARPSPATRR